MVDKYEDKDKDLWVFPDNLNKELGNLKEGINEENKKSQLEESIPKKLLEQIKQSASKQIDDKLDKISIDKINTNNQPPENIEKSATNNKKSEQKNIDHLWKIPPNLSPNLHQHELDDNIKQLADKTRDDYNSEIINDTKNIWEKAPRLKWLVDKANQ